MRKLLAIILVIICASVGPVAYGDSLSGSPDVPFTVLIENFVNGDGSITYRASYLVSTALEGALSDAGYCRQDLVDGLSLLHKGYEVKPPRREGEILFELYVPYEDEISGAKDSPYTTYGFLINEFNQSQDISAHQAGRTNQLKALFRARLPRIGEDAVNGSSFYYVYATPYKSVRSNATILENDGETYYHVFPLKGATTMQISVTSPNSAGWYGLIGGVALLLVISGFTALTVMKIKGKKKNG